ncbi:MAG TPA: energy transducer TonB, partial [Parasegetibacter sp.]
SMGPKRMQGDYQVPEGFYYINEFNPRSSFHLSLGINYPNLSDRLLSDSRQPGGDIYIHGSCVTTGCIPITDSQIEELYILTAHAKNLGQDFIPVHIFPVNFKNSNSEQYLAKYLQAFADYNPFVSRLKEVFLYFEKYRRLPVIAVNNKGEYVTNIDPEEFVEAPPVPKKQFIPKKRTKVHFDESTIPTTVNNLPVYPGGNEAFQEYLKTLSTGLAGFLDGSRHTEYVMVEFIVDSTGKVLNPEVIKGGNDEMNEKILDSFERMPQWKPALRQDKPVPMKLKQTIVVEKL